MEGFLDSNNKNEDLSKVLDIFENEFKKD